MKVESDDVEQISPIKKISFARLLKRSKNIEQEVELAAGELTAINAELMQDNKVRISAQRIQTAIGQNESVELNVAQAADDLNRVNTQLVREMDKRVTIESELADTKVDLAGVREDLWESQAKEREARETALQDHLTGIPNRAAFEQALKHGLAEARRRGWKLAVLFIDIDQFKSINDCYGHDQGDKVLRMVATRLQSALRQEDTACRWGGDEFLCLLLEVKPQTDVSRLAKKLVSRIAEPCELNGTVFSVKTSVGIAIFPEDGATIDSLLKNADTAMYKAKGTKQSVVLFRESSGD